MKAFSRNSFFIYSRVQVALNSPNLATSLILLKRGGFVLCRFARCMKYFSSVTSTTDSVRFDLSSTMMSVHRYS